MARQEDRTHFRGVRKPPGEAFPVVLGEALRRRGLTLAETREALAQRGQSISVATLSYWRAGRRVPEGPASLDVLDCLDEVLHLEPGTLRASLGPSRRHGPATQEYVGLPSFVRPSEAATRALVDLGLEHAESAVAEEYVVVAVDVDVRGQETRAVVRSRLRALRDGVDRRPLVVDAGEPIAEPVTVVSAHGCRVGRTHLDLAVGLQVHELLLERPLALGETATVEYELRLADTAEPETEFVFHCARRVGEVEVWVRFDPRLVPAEAEVFVVDATGVERASAVDMTGTRSIVSAVRHVGPGTVGARWTWPTVPGVLGVPERDAQDTAADAARTPLPPEPGVRPT